MLSMVLTKTEHQVFTNKWRQLIPYGTKKTSKKESMNAARKVYKDYPEILDVLGL
jgi:hypothetical protein